MSAQSGNHPTPRWGPERTYRSRPTIRRRGGPDVSGVPLDEISEDDLVDADGHRFAPAGFVGDDVLDEGDPRFDGYPHDQGYSAPSTHGSPRPSRGRPARAGTVRRQRRGGRRRHPVRWVLLLLILAVLIYPLALAQVAMSKLTRVDALSTAPDTPGHTYLIVGSDSRAGTDLEAVEGSRTDTIVMLHVPTSGPTVMLSIPRDSYVEIPGHGDNKVNAAFALGGPKLLVETVEQATGVKVDGYIETGLAGFGDIVDAVGGITICPKEAMHDDMVALDVQAGCQPADGAVALAYARSRYIDPRGDLGRVDRQREVMSQIASEASSPATLANPFDAFRLASAGGSALTVDNDLGMIQLTYFLYGMKESAGGKGLSLTVPVADTSRHTKNGVVVDWDEEQAGVVFAALKDSSTEAIRPIAEQQAAALGG